MDDWFISFLLFVLSFLVYYHVQKQYKTSEDLEIYETDYVSRKELQPTLELKQPVLFSFPTPGISHNDIKDLKTLLCIRDIREFYQPDTASVDPILLPMESGRGLLHSDTKHLYFSDCNQDLVDEPLVSYKCSQFDDVLQPPFCSVTKHDVLFGSRKAYTPMTYHTYSQRFLLVQGDSAHCGIRIKMAPWKNTPHLHCRKDYGRFERWSIKNMFRGDEDQFKLLDFVVNPGYVLYVPPYWWYTMQFLDESTCVTSVTYSTVINVLSNAKEYALFYYHQRDLYDQMYSQMVPDVVVPNVTTPLEQDTAGDHTDADIDVAADDSPPESQDVSLELIEDLKPSETKSPDKT